MDAVEYVRGRRDYDIALSHINVPKETFGTVKRVLTPQISAQTAIASPIHCIPINLHSKFIMVSTIDRAKRCLVSLLKSLAVVYGIALDISRDASDKVLWCAVLCCAVLCCVVLCCTVK